MVLEAQSPTIRRFLERLLPEQNAELPCMNEWASGKYHPSSFKDVHAQAHCAAAYLMSRGLRKGDNVALIAKPGLRYHVMNIALQFLGAVNVTIPHSFTEEDIQSLHRRYHFSLLFADSAAQFLDYGQFQGMKQDLLGVIIGEDEVDALHPEKIVTYDRVVTLGKSAWREEANALKMTKGAVLPQDMYAILLDPDGKATPMSIEQWMDAVESAEKSLLTSQVKSFISAITPDRLLWRSFGFAAVRNRISWWIRPDQSLKGAGYLDIKPQLLLLNPQGLSVLFDLLPEIIDSPEKGRRAIIASQDVVRHREDAKALGRKNPLFNRFAYWTSNRKLYKRIRAKLGGRISEIACDQGLVDLDAMVFFEEAGIKVRQW